MIERFSVSDNLNFCAHFWVYVYLIYCSTYLKNFGMSKIYKTSNKYQLPQSYMWTHNVTHFILVIEALHEITLDYGRLNYSAKKKKKIIIIIIII